MGNKQIGWSQEANLLQEVVNQLQQLNKTIGSLAITTTSTTTTAP
jgi:hypothetical protein